MKVGALVLAAGASTRMQGANKLLLPVNGLPMIAAVCDAVLAAGYDPVIVVTGHDETLIRAALIGKSITFAHNPDWKAGMSGSIRTGLAALPPAADGVLIALADMPRVGPPLLRTLMDRFERQGGGNRIVYPEYGGQQGNPVLFPREHFPEIAALSGDRGAKAVLQSHRGAALAVAVDTPDVILDCDSEADYLKLMGSRKEDNVGAA